jgi:hypothetical protein
MIAPDGTPKVLEFNCRFGDPETQPIMLRLKSDLVELSRRLDGRLDQDQARWDPRAALGVVMAAGGYPGEYRKGDVISGLPAAADPDLQGVPRRHRARDGAWSAAAACCASPRSARPEGGGGLSCLVEDGDVLERGGVNFSHVKGDKLPPSASAHRPELAGRRWEAMGVSLVMHPRNPYAPTVHMNVRFFVA